VSMAGSVVSMSVVADVTALAAQALAADDPPLPPEPIAAPPESVHSRMDYGSHAGMQVSILGMEGRDTAHAVIRFAHTRDNAISYCRDSLEVVELHASPSPALFATHELAQWNPTTAFELLDAEFVDHAVVGWRRVDGDTRQQERYL
jgi:hypothetical protein